MIEITPTIRTKYRSAFTKARTEKIRCVRLESDLYYVARREAGHGRYLVRFFHTGEGVSVVCSSIYNQPCESTKKPGQCCVHIAAAVERGIKLGRARERKEAA
jgi:hypothetical protein